MSLYRYKGSKVWTMEFQFQGQRVRESTGTHNKGLAQRVERNRRLELEEGRAGLKKIEGPKLFKTVAAEWVELKSPTWTPNMYRIECTNLRHLNKVFGTKLVTDISPQEVAGYQKSRLADGYANKTVNLEWATLRSVLIYCGQWARVQGTGKSTKTKALTVRNDIGIALSAEDESKLLTACSMSRSRSLIVIGTLALYTGARFIVIRNLKWGDVDLKNRQLKFGQDKTLAGDFRTIPLASRAVASLTLWAESFPDRKPEHYVFPSERYGSSGHKFGSEGDRRESVAYDTNPLKPIGSVKTAWEGAQKRSGVRCRIHDLRHTAVSRMVAEEVSLPEIAQIVGWSASQMVLMIRRYGHFSTKQLRKGVEKIHLPESPVNSPVSAQRIFENRAN